MSSPSPNDRPANRLAGETSPYLLQHAHNPVDWYPWGDEAFAKARAENRPIFLSVGYSACHWCHVMERESFEDPHVAALMNEHFINIKVDREERPDVDQIYMAAVQAIAGQGGWPMSVFLTPEGKPFFGGTYYPPSDRHGMPGFPRVLLSVARAWREKRDDIARSADELTGQIRESSALPAGSGELSTAILDGAAKALARAFEPIHGGFGHAPKFPHPMDLRVLLRQYYRTGDQHALHIVRHTLDKMARGGIYDHLGGGFARYSTDERWLVPHFEKMLYDNALLASTYLEAYQVTKDEAFARVARGIFGYIEERMTDPQGGFYATEDADSEGEEGKFYVWTTEEIEAILGPERAKTFLFAYDVTPGGNWEGRSILNQPRTIEEIAKALGREPKDEELAKILDRDPYGLDHELSEAAYDLFEARERRVPPGKDTKILASWNGLMIAALADGAAVLDPYRNVLTAARKAAGFVLDAMRTPEGRLLHVYKDGRARFDAYLDDYACLIDGLTRLFEASGELRWIEAALDLARILIEDFADPDGGFFYTGKDHEALIVRTKDQFDNATPSGNGMAATALLRLAALTGREDLAEAGRRTLQAAQTLMEQAPAAAGQSLIALDFLLATKQEFAQFVGDDGRDGDDFVGTSYRVRRVFRPHAVFAFAEGKADDRLAEVVPLLADRSAIGGETTLYVCEGFACQAPLVGRMAIDVWRVDDINGSRASS